MRVTDGIGRISEYDPSRIFQSIKREIPNTATYYDLPPLTDDQIDHVVHQVGNSIQKMQLATDTVTESLIRDLVYIHLPEGYRDAYSTVGMTVNNALSIDLGAGDGDNANLQHNPETSHKRKADDLSKQQALYLLPRDLAHHHITGDLHIHDLEYFCTRIFCCDHDLRYTFYYGFAPDGSGEYSSIAGAAKRAEVAVLHAVKALSASQCSCAGGQGYYNFLTFLAPYVEGLSYKEIEHLMQMFVYEMTQMLVSRGGQSTSFNEQLVVKERNGTIRLIPIGELCHRYLKKDGSKNIELEGLETISLNKETGEIEWQPITGVHVHKPKSPLLETRLHDGRTVVTTSDHSLFTLDGECNIIESKPSDNPKTVLTTYDIPCIDGISFDKDLMFLIGVVIGDGCLVTNDTTISLCCSNEAVQMRTSEKIRLYGRSRCEWRDKGDENCKQTNFSTRDIPYINEIGHGASNKKIPDELLNGDTESLYALLDGLISTDGNTNRGRYEYNTTSVKLKDQIEFVLNRLGIRYTIRKATKGSNYIRNYPVWSFIISSSDSQKLVITNTDRQIPKSDRVIEQNHHDFSMLRDYIKRECTEPMYKRGHVFKSNTRKIKRTHLESIQDMFPGMWSKVKHILPSAIESITVADPEEYVYDISVANNENFVLNNGFVLHNSLVGSERIIMRNPVGEYVPMMIGQFCEMYLKESGATEISDGWEALSMNLETMKPEWKPITAVHIHIPETPIVRTVLEDGRTICTTSDHSLFTMGIDGKPVTVSPADNPKRIIASTLKSLYIPHPLDMSLDSIALKDVEDVSELTFDTHGKKISAPLKYYGRVYDISVADNQNFVTIQGIVAHNTVFSSVQLTPGVPKLWKEKPVVYKGKKFDGKSAMLRTYGEFEREVRLLFEALMNVMLQGDNRGKPFLFPKPEISIERQFIEDGVIDTPHRDALSYRDLYLKSFELASKFGTPYFDNMIPEYRGTEDQIACVQCCAYFFGSGEDSDPLFEKKMFFEDGHHFTMGSLQVVTLNMPRIAYRSKSVEEFIENAKRLIESAIRIFQVKRSFIDKMFEYHRVGYLEQRLPDPTTGQPGSPILNLDDFVYTIGIIGMNEVVEHLVGSPIHEDGLTVAMKIVMALRTHAINHGKKNGITVAFARTPAETTGQRFAYLDLVDPAYSAFASKVVKGDRERSIQMAKKGMSNIPGYYTNGAHVSPVVNIPITERIQKEGVFHPLLDGGNITHIWLGEGKPDPRGMMDFALNISRNTLTGYYAFTRDMTVHKRRYRIQEGLFDQ